jgi:hypothetical protein
MPFLRLPGGAIGAPCIISRYVAGDGAPGKESIGVRRVEQQIPSRGGIAVNRGMWPVIRNEGLVKGAASAALPMGEQGDVQ